MVAKQADKFAALCASHTRRMDAIDELLYLPNMLCWDRYESWGIEPDRLRVTFQDGSVFDRSFGAA